MLVKKCNFVLKRFRYFFLENKKELSLSKKGNDNISEIQKSVGLLFFLHVSINAVTLKTIQNALIYISHFAEICQHLSSMLRKGTDDTASTPQDAKIDAEVKRASKTVTKRKSNTSASDLALVNGVRQTSDMTDGAAQGVIH